MNNAVQRGSRSKASKELTGAQIPLLALIADERQRGPWICTGGDEEDTKDRTKQKACLERYRKACIEILGVLNKAAPQVYALPACPTCTAVYSAMLVHPQMLQLSCPCREYTHMIIIGTAFAGHH